MRAAPFLAAFVVLLASFTLPPGADATPTLTADAGQSQVAYDGATITLDGQARGGTAPYAFSWSYGNNSAFSSTTVAAPAFSTALTGVGNHTLTLTVTDSLGATATDTVRINATTTSAGPSFAGVFYAIVDDEQLGEGLDNRVISYNVPPRTGILQLTLTWTTPGGAVAADLDLKVRDPFGGDAAPTQGHAGTNPERVTVLNPHQGTWTITVQPRNGAAASYALHTRMGATVLPEVFAMGDYDYGSTDVQALEPLARASVAPYTFEWDLDGDGWFETAGGAVTASQPIGVHNVTVRATDAAGFSASSTNLLIVRSGDKVLKMVCGGDASYPYWAMEFTASRGTCWIHGGHHTYYARGTYAFLGLRGWGFSVEQEFAPSGDVVNLTREPVTTPLYVEVSLDGKTWTTVGSGTYEYGPLRQTVWLDVTGSGQPFRFLRLHVPLSLSQGLSGYLDHSNLRLEADALPTLTAPAPATSRTLDCEDGDVMEDFFAEHPCWFGGVDRYDSPSFFHTYVVGPESDVTRIRGSFTLAPWRSDDFFAGQPINTAQSTHAFVQVSADGIHWTTVGTFAATYGVTRAFDVTVTANDVTFVRLFPQYHALFDQWATAGPNHHPRAYFLDSEVTVDGLFNDWV